MPLRMLKKVSGRLPWPLNRASGSGSIIACKHAVALRSRAGKQSGFRLFSQTGSLILVLLLASDLSAQMPRGIYAWWNRPQIARDLNLSLAQREQIRSAVQQYRPHLINARGAVRQAEQALADQFNRDPVDPGKTNQAIEQLVDARGDLTRSLTQLSLKLRLVLTEQQWQELQRRRPDPGTDPASPEP
jgi:Spy/CpxP family protein refolding chaperone